MRELRVFLTETEMSQREGKCYIYRVIVCSIVGGLLTGYAYVISLDGTISLHRITLPAVFPIATLEGTIGGLLMSPIVYRCLRYKNLLVAFPVVYFFTASWTIACNLLASPLGLYGSFGGLLIILFL